MCAGRQGEQTVQRCENSARKLDGLGNRAIEQRRAKAAQDRVRRREWNESNSANMLMFCQMNTIDYLANQVNKIRKSFKHHLHSHERKMNGETLTMHE